MVRNSTFCSLHSVFLPRSGRGFTLTELLLTISIGAILVGIALAVINPAELFAQARDQRRVSDLGQIEIALQGYYNSGLALDMDGASYSNGCNNQASPRLFVSVPNGESGTAPGLPAGWTLTQALASVALGVSGNGWIPINFSAIPGGSPIPALPVDPINSFDQNLFYSYVCKSTGDFELTAYFESQKYGSMRKEDRARLDGGTDPTLYEVGSDLTLDPLSPSGYWSFNEGTGGTAYDSSGNGKNGTLTGFNFSGSSDWVSAGQVGKALSFDGSDDYVNVSSINPTSTVSLLAWIKSASSTYNALWSAVSKYNAYVLGPSNNGSSLMCFIVYITGAGGWTPWPPAAGTNCYSVSTPNAWHHFAATFSGSASQVKLYMDGVLRATSSVSGTAIDNDTGPIFLGHRECAGCTEYLAATLDEIRIYSRTLSAKEVDRIYNFER